MRDYHQCSIRMQLVLEAEGLICKHCAPTYILGILFSDSHTNWTITLMVCIAFLAYTVGVPRVDRMISPLSRWHFTWSEAITPCIIRIFFNSVFKLDGLIWREADTSCGLYLIQCCLYYFYWIVCAIRYSMYIFLFFELDPLIQATKQR